MNRLGLCSNLRSSPHQRPQPLQHRRVLLQGEVVNEYLFSPEVPSTAPASTMRRISRLLATYRYASRRCRTRNTRMVWDGNSKESLTR